MKQYDLIVLGAGSGGIATANRAASYGASVLLIEKGRLGGTCVNVGCVPKKLMWYAAEMVSALKHAKGFGISVTQDGFDWLQLKVRRDAFIRKLNGLYGENLQRNHVDIISGEGRLSGEKTVTVNGESYHGQHILIATGGQPAVPDVPGSELGIVSDDFFELGQQPDSVAIIGGGYIGVELAGIFAALGTRVEMFVRSERLLKSYDEDLTTVLAEQLVQQGIRLHFNSEIASLSREGGKSQIEMTDKDGDKHVAFDQVLWATGRNPNTAELGLREQKIELDNQGYVVTDEWQQTSQEYIYAVGDVTGRAALTPVAIAAGRRLADRLFGGMGGRKLNYSLIPTVVFSHPPLATVGLSEYQARQQYDDVKIYVSRFNPMSMALSPADSIKTLVKLIVAGEEERVLGCHVIGDGADELLQGFAVAMHMGACKRDFDDTIAIHPTSAEELVTLR